MSTIPRISARREPSWLSWRRFRLRAAPPRRLSPWLRDTGSLTARLKTCCGAQGFRVEVLGQRWGRPLPGEARLLGMRAGERALVREVRLTCGARGAWVFARTLIPAASLRGSALRLTHLGERPLGQLLFSDPNAHRGTTAMARLLPIHPLYQAALAGRAMRPGVLWGRRTLFRFRGYPLLVTEIFLPELPDFPR